MFFTGSKFRRASSKAHSVKTAPVLLLLRGRDRTSQVNRVKLGPTRAPPDFEQDVFPRFHARDGMAVGRRPGEIRVVYFRDWKDPAPNKHLLPARPLALPGPPTHHK